jgi:hypothetical protein
MKRKIMGTNSVQPVDKNFTKIQDFVYSHLKVPYFPKASILGHCTTHNALFLFHLLKEPLFKHSNINLVLPV